MKWIYLFLPLLLIGACTYTLPIEDGRMAYERKQYSVAVDMLKKEYNKAKSRVEKGKLAFLLGGSYEALNQSDSAIDWYKIAYDNQYGIEAQERYAYALKQAERYEEAMEAFRDLGLEIGSPYEYRREIQAALIAREWKQRDRVAYKAYPAEFNSAQADYAPALYKDDQMVITSDRTAASGDDTYAWTGKNFSDLFLVDLRTSNVSPFATELNTDGNEGTAAFAPNYQEIYFSRCASEERADAYCRIMRSTLTADGAWSEPTPVGFMEDGVNYLHPALSPDGNMLYFASNHPDGWGGYDIYRSERLENGAWDVPVLMGRSVNTVYDEQFPYVDADTLYFASDGHTGMGGLDIYRTYEIQPGRWAPAQNMLPPINSGSDDFGIVFRKATDLAAGVLREGYFTSRRFDGVGGDDIYRFERVVLPPEPEPEPVIANLFLDVYVLEKIYADPTDPNSRVLGRKPLAEAELTYTSPEGATKSVTLDETGKFSLEIEEDNNYRFLAEANDYLSNEGSFNSRGIARAQGIPEQRYELEIELDKIFREREITLENIYYDFDQAYIREDAQPTLNELADLLRLNPDIRIQLGSHTDCRGNPRYNEALSQRRAQSAVDYLIQKGIEPIRLRARGYGEEVPAVDCACTRCTEEEHQVNRRTTFQILE